MRARKYGKVLGLIAGWLLLRHPVGALLGLLLGHAFDTDAFGGPSQDARPEAEPPAGDDPYRVLGVPANASDADIDRAYRQRIRQYHPDKLFGIAEDLRRQAERKAGEINAAYDRIKALRRRG